MRYHFIDEIVSLALDGTPRIEVAKRFDPADDVFGGPEGPGRIPGSMLLELMATTGRLDGAAAAGDRLRAVATLRGLTSVADGTSVAQTESGVYIEATPIASARLMFVCVEPTAVGLARGPGA